MILRLNLKSHINGDFLNEDNCDLKGYDLIFMDYDLKNGKSKLPDNTGDKIIKQIRDNKVYSNIIFYSSASSDLPQKVKENDIQNTYVFDREDFRDENIEVIYDVIEFALNRANSINIMRGIIMAELASFDDFILEIIENSNIVNKWEKIYDLITKGHQRQCQTLIETHTDLVENKEELIKQCEDIRTKHSQEKIKELIFDADQSSAIFPSGLRANFLNSIIKQMKISLPENNDFKQNYTVEILQKRNKLGHCRSISDCSDEDFLEIRKNILKHRKNLNEIKIALESQTA